MQKDLYAGAGNGGRLAGLVVDENGWRVALAPAGKRGGAAAADDGESFAEEDHGFQEHGYEDHELTDDDLD